MDLCRLKGIREISIDGVSFKIEDVTDPKTQPKDYIEDLPTYTDEQLATWSGDGA